MTSFVAAYLIVWLAVGLFVLRLGARQRRLERTVTALQREFGEPAPEEPPRCRAA